MQKEEDNNFAQIILLEDFGKVIEKLEEVLNLEKTEINRDSAIKRFELCFDLAWKSIKELAKQQGIECYSPRACFKEAFQMKLIEHNEQWLEMLNDRNLTVHIYKEQYAEQVYSHLSVYLELFRELLAALEKFSGINIEKPNAK